MTRFTLRRHYLNSQGYDSAGSYWGVDLPLYWFSSEIKIDSEYREGFLRAVNRDDAKHQIKLLFHDHQVTFYN